MFNIMLYKELCKKAIRKYESKKDRNGCIRLCSLIITAYDFQKKDLKKLELTRFEFAYIHAMRAIGLMINKKIYTYTRDARIKNSLSEALNFLMPPKNLSIKNTWGHMLQLFDLPFIDSLCSYAGVILGLPFENIKFGNILVKMGRVEIKNKNLNLAEIFFQQALFKNPWLVSANIGYTNINLQNVKYSIWQANFSIRSTIETMLQRLCSLPSYFG